MDFPKLYENDIVTAIETSYTPTTTEGHVLVGIGQPLKRCIEVEFASSTKSSDDIVDLIRIRRPGWIDLP